MLPEAQRAAGIGAAQDLLQDGRHPIARSARQRGNHQGTPVRILTSPGIPKRPR